jgi:hypothetical protein
LSKRGRFAKVSNNNRRNNSLIDRNSFFYIRIVTNRVDRLKVEDF